ncbi:MAG: hypothetical protein FIB06_01590 [Betaproteobacteria bacterium]|nr:hypothetical protein [Betaproteobacteria bacterium]
MDLEKLISVERIREILAGMPEIRDAFTGAVEQEEREARAARLEALDQYKKSLAALEKEQRARAKVLARVQSAQEQLDKENALLCEADELLKGAARRNSSAWKSLLGHGEYSVWQAETQLVSILASLEQNLSGLRAMDLRSIHPEKRPEIIDRIGEAEKKLAVAKRVEKEILALKLSEASPGEIESSVSSAMQKIQ